MAAPHVRRSDRAVYLALRRANAALPWLRELLPRRLRDYLVDRGIPGHESRRYLEEVVLAGLARSDARRVLFVGCRSYTSHYGRWFRDSAAELWTLDIDPAAARWGEPNRHLVGDVTHVDEVAGRSSVDALLLNGVFGFGVDERAAMERTIQAIERTLTPNGLLMIGWDRDRVEDPSSIEALHHFRRETEAPFQRVDWPLEGFVMDFFRAPAGPAPGPSAGWGDAQ